MFIEHGLEGVFLEGAAAFHPGGFSVGKGIAALENHLVLPRHQFQVPVLAELVPVFNHGVSLLRKIFSREGTRRDTKKRRKEEKNEVYKGQDELRIKDISEDNLVSMVNNQDDVEFSAQILFDFINYKNSSEVKWKAPSSGLYLKEVIYID